MVDLTFPQLNSDQGTATADALRNRANAAADLLCDAYQNYPGALLPGTIDPAGVAAFTDGLLGGLCAPRGKTPPPPARPFEGGQCEKLYRRIGTLTDALGSRPIDRGTGFGKFSNFRSTTINDGFGERRGWFVDQGVGTPNQELGIALAESTRLSEFPSPTYSFQPVTVDGSSDNCGSLPPVYPDVTPPPAAYDRNVPVDAPGRSVNVPVTIIPVIFPPGAIQFRPEFNVDVGGVNVNFDLGGVSFSVGKPAPSQPRLPGFDPRPLPPAPIQPRSPIVKCEPYNDASLRCKITTLQTKLLNGGFDVVNGSTAIAQSGEFEALAGNFYRATVIITQRPLNLRIQSSTAPADDVWYVGWFSWLENDSPGERMPLHFQRSTFLAPPGVTGFMYQLNFGCLGNAVYQRRIPKEFVDVC